MGKKLLKKNSNKKKSKVKVRKYNPNSSIALRRWNLVRSSISSYAKLNNKKVDSKRLNSLTKMTYDHVKTNFKANEKVLDEVVSNWLFGEGSTLPFFSWWLLENQLDEVSVESTVIIDSTDQIPDYVNSYYVGSREEFLLIHLTSFVEYMNRAYQREAGNYPTFVVYTKSIDGKEAKVFKLMDTEEDAVVFDEYSFDSWLTEKGISLEAIVGSTGMEEVSRYKKKYGNRRARKPKSAFKRKIRILESPPVDNTKKDKTNGKSNKKSKKTNVSKSVSVAKNKNWIIKKEKELRKMNPNMSDKEIKKIIKLFSK